MEALDQKEVFGKIDVLLNAHPNSKITSAYKSLNLSDWQKGAILAFMSPIIYTVGNALYAWLSGNPFVVDWKHLLSISVTMLTAYLFKNFFTKPSIQIPVSDAEQKVDEKVMEPTSK